MPKKRTVLFVDDDMNYLEGVRRSFYKWGVNCIFENSGEAALLSIQEKDPDVLVIDNMMPGMGGVRLATEVAKHFPSIMIIMLSGALSTKELIRAINDGHVYKVFEKPCRIDDLKNAIIAAMKHKIDLESRFRSTSADDYTPIDW